MQVAGGWLQMQALAQPRSAVQALLSRLEVSEGRAGQLSRPKGVHPEVEEGAAVRPDGSRGQAVQEALALTATAPRLPDLQAPLAGAAAAAARARRVTPRRAVPQVQLAAAAV